MMHMTFYWGKSVTVLFDSWKTDSWLSYTPTLLALFLFSVFYQYMEDRRLRFKFLFATAKPSPSSSPPSITTSLLHPARNRARFASSILFGLNSAIGYLLMLAVMSYNGGVFIAVVLGLFVGYLIFRSGSNEDAIVVENPCACA